jgi:hypothetical protein
MIVPYNPQQNVVAERKNRAITGAARSMLHDQSLPLYLWAEACATAVYLQNRNPHSILRKMTPEEAFTDRRPDVEHIKIFGCSTFSHVPLERRTKLDPTTLLRFGYLGKWSPCAYESLRTKGEDYYPHTLLYDSNFTLT